MFGTGMEQNNRAGRKFVRNTVSNFLCGEPFPVQGVDTPLNRNTAALMDTVDDSIIIAAGRWTEENRSLTAGFLNALL